MKTNNRESNKGQNGKGDKNRTASLSQFQKNYDKIKWQKPSGEFNIKNDIK